MEDVALGAGSRSGGRCCGCADVCKGAQRVHAPAHAMHRTDVQYQRRFCTRSAGGRVWGSRDVCLVGEAGWCLCYGVVGRNVNAASSAQQMGKDTAAGGLRPMQWASRRGKEKTQSRRQGEARRGELRDGDGDGGAVNASVRTLRLQGGDVLSGISVFLAPKFSMLRAFLCQSYHTQAQSTH